MPLKLDGKPFELNPLSNLRARALEFLKKAPSDEIYSSSEMNNQLGVGQTYVQHYLCNDPKFADYTCRIRSKRYFGNSKAILALRKQIENESK